MAATLRHFAINAEDVERARQFYRAVCGWNFTPWGPPGYVQTRDAGNGLMGAIQERVEQGKDARLGIVTTFGVDDIRAALAATEAHGGRIVAQPFRIEGVGEIGYIEDCEGNLCALAQYVEGYWG